MNGEYGYPTLVCDCKYIVYSWLVSSGQVDGWVHKYIRQWKDMLIDYTSLIFTFAKRIFSCHKGHMCLEFTLHTQ